MYFVLGRTKFTKIPCELNVGTTNLKRDMLHDATELPCTLDELLTGLVASGVLFVKFSLEHQQLRAQILHDGLCSCITFSMQMTATIPLGL
jgi:hypothetical protein